MTKLTIHIVKHKATNADIPVIVTKVNGANIIESYREFTEGRNAFNLDMLVKRWGKPSEEVLDLLARYQVPAHLNQANFDVLNPVNKPVEVALFFEEYILAIEKKELLAHSKLKAKSLDKFKQDKINHG